MKPSLPDDLVWMKDALVLAGKGKGLTSPNPAVGALLVKNGKLLAEGWHRQAGSPHAEIEALRNLPDPSLAHGATLYVTLEPCSTTGRTPPCTAAIIEAGISRVVYGATDPNPAHAGRARRILQKAGLAVSSGIFEEQCIALNREWNYFIKTGLPWVILKSAFSLDGRIVPGGPQPWVTSPAARLDARSLRAGVDAILVGGETLRKDNPRLTLRHGQSTSPRSPRRIIWSRSPNLPDPKYHVFSDPLSSQTLLFREPSWPRLLQFLARHGITSVLVEGGGQVAGTVVDSGLVQEIVFYLAPKFLGGPVAAVRGEGIASPSDALRLTKIEISQVGPDLKYRALVLPHTNPPVHSERKTSPGACRTASQAGQSPAKTATPITQTGMKSRKSKG